MVEDSEDVLDVAQEWLADLGYRVVTVRSGNEALAWLDDHPQRTVDLLFTDLLMPGGMNGLVLAEQVSKRVPGISVLLTTGYHEDLILEGPRAPTMDVLGKPYRRMELASRVRASLANRARGEARTTASAGSEAGPSQAGLSAPAGAPAAALPRLAGAPART